MLEDKRIIVAKLIGIFVLALLLVSSAASRLLGLPLSSPISVLLFLLCLPLIYAIHVVFYRPLDRIVDDKFGYYTDPGRSKRHQVDQLRRLRWRGDMPPAFANGWYPVIESHLVRRGEAKSMNMIGLVLAIFRDISGTVHILDAYCPHLGANLGVGGRVIGDCLECPFHAWRFRGIDGRCVHVPTLGESDKIPDKARVKSYHVHEVNDWIHIWFDAEGREPHWRLPKLEEITNGRLTFRGRCEHVVHCHMEDLPENGADMAHLPVVHNASLLDGHDLRTFQNGSTQLTAHDFRGSWEPAEPPNDHIAIMKVKQSFKVMGKDLPGSSIDVHIEQIGPAVVYLKFNTIFGRMVISHVVIPQEALVQKLVHNIFAQTSIPTAIAKIFLLGMTKQVDRDNIIWNNKFYARQPLLLKTPEDAIIQRHRRWYRQFYSENSPKISNRAQDGLEW